MSSTPPQRVGRWPVKRPLGQGGFSWVFEVEDENLKVRRALKMLKPEAGQGEGYKRFWREARILASIDDPHLVRIYELDRDAATGNDYYVMEFLTGSDLAKLLKEGPLPVERAVRILLGALQGLARLHAQKPPVIHRDIKPANIQITDDGVPKLLDLGIARMARPAGDETVIGASEITVMAAFMGTVKYASPEQLRVRDLAPSSDVFSMGLALFEAIEGRHPYGEQPDLPTQSYQDVLGLYAQLEATRGGLALRFEKTPKPIQAVIRRALAIPQAERFADAGAMRTALEQALQGRAPAPAPPSRSAAAPPRGKRRSLPILPIAGGVLALALLGGTAYYWTQREAPSPAGPSAPAAPSPVSREPSADQLASRKSASDLTAQLEAAIAAGRLTPAAVAPARAALAQADARWAAGEFPEAARGYDGMRALALEALAVAPAPPAVDLAALESAARAARDAAARADAAKLASAGFAKGDAELARARAAAAEGRARDAEAAFGEARAAFAAAQSEAEAKAAGEPLEVNAPPMLAVSPKGPLSLEAGQQVVIVARARDPEGDRVGVQFRVHTPSGSAYRHEGDSFTFSPSAAGDYSIEVVATDVRGAASPPVRIVAKVAPAPAPLVVAAAPKPPPQPPAPAAGAVSAELRSVLDEYAAAIRSSDIEALRAVWRMDPTSERLFDRLFRTYGSMAVSVTPLSEQVSGTTATVRFAQSLQGVSPQGTMSPITEGPMVAELTKRADGWQITSLKRGS